MSTITMDFRHHYQRGERREAEQVAYQWDLGHVAEIFVPLDATYNISYCFSDYDKTDDYAIESITAADDGGYKLTAHVPNKYFERSGELRVYIIGEADDHIITTYEGFLTIRSRLEPDDYVDPDPENGLPIGTLRIPSFLIHNGDKVAHLTVHLHHSPFLHATPG